MNAALRHVLATKPRLGEVILAAFIARRSILLSGAAVAIRLVGSRFSPESLRLREFLARNRIPHEWIDADRDAAVERLLRESDIAPADLPVVFVSGAVFRRPTPGSGRRRLTSAPARPGWRPTGSSPRTTSTAA